MKFEKLENTVPSIPTANFEGDLIFTKNRQVIRIDSEFINYIGDNPVGIKNINAFCIDENVSKLFQFISCARHLWKFIHNNKE